jgi:outer membrane protein TolC
MAAPIALLGASGCALVRPVDVTPPPPFAPPAHYVTDVPAPPPRPASGTVSPGNGGEVVPESDGAPSEPSRPHAPPPGAPWWSAFADPALDDAIQEALRNNYTMRDTRTLIYENQLDPSRPGGILWPLQVTIPSTLQHSTQLTLAENQDGSFAPAEITSDTLDVGIVASYQVDVWGKLDAHRRTLDDVIEQQRQNTEVFAQTLAEQVTQLWFEILEQRALRDLLGTQVQYSQELLAIVKARFEQHLVPHLAALQQEQQLFTTQAQVPLVTSQIAILNSRLTALLGRIPTPSPSLVPDDRRLPDLPSVPAVGGPLDLARTSPEMHVAQARVAEAEHLVNENLAAWLPTVEAFGSANIQWYNLAQRYPSAAAGIRLTWPIFDGGQRVLRAKQLELTVQRRNWQYELAFKSAVQRVQEALVQEQKQTDHLKAVRAQVDLARRVLTEARQLFEQGLSDYLPVLTALASLSNLERASIQAQRLLLSYRVQLYHALGGNWSASATKMDN